MTVNETVETIKTEGINPFHQREEEIERMLVNSHLTSIIDQTTEIHFYGAGCNYEDKIALVHRAISNVFPTARVIVQHDLLAAARALCGREEGIACILGTGSNSCHYNGDKIIDNNPSLGYILGDEGSGVSIGKRLIQDYLYGKLPKSVANRFDKKYDITIDTILDNVYRRYLPNRYLASFSYFIKENIDHPYIHGLVYESFYEFIDNHVFHYKDYQKLRVHFTGSIAWHYQNILKKVAEDSGIQIGKIIMSPIDGLTLYHQNKI